MTKIYLIRHAEAEGNLYRIAHGQYNSAITPRGYRQLAALRRRFQDIPVDAVYGSDLLRAQTTASAIYQPRGLEFHPMPLLREVNLGVWEGLTWAEIRRLDPQMLADFNRRPDRWHVEGGETFDAVRNRMLEAVRRLAAENPGKTVAATSHGAALRVLLGALEGMTLEETGAAGHCDNTGVSLLEVEGDDMRVVFQSDASHLAGELSTLGRQGWHKSLASAEPGLWYRVREADGVRVQEAMLDAEPVGRIEMAGEADALRVTHCELIPAQRGNHFGIQMMGQPVQLARRLGKEKVVLRCLADRESFFAQLGYETTARSGGVCEMELDVRPVIRDIPEWEP